MRLGYALPCLGKHTISIKYESVDLNAIIISLCSGLCYKWHLLDAFLLCLLESFLGCSEVNDLPDGLEVVCLYILVLQVEGVLPSINANQGNVSCISIRQAGVSCVYSHSCIYKTYTAEGLGLQW